MPLPAIVASIGIMNYLYCPLPQYLYYLLITCTAFALPPLLLYYPIPCTGVLLPV